MKTNEASLSVLGILVIAALLVIGILEIQHVYAQVDATSSDVVATSSIDATPADDAATSTAVETTIPAADAVTSDSTSSPETTPSKSVTPIKPPPEGLTEAHIIGMKYIDYFTDGTAEYSFPGDPAIDDNFDKPNARFRRTKVLRGYIQ